MLTGKGASEGTHPSEHKPAATVAQHTARVNFWRTSEEHQRKNKTVDREWVRLVQFATVWPPTSCIVQHLWRKPRVGNPGEKQCKAWEKKNYLRTVFHQLFEFIVLLVTDSTWSILFIFKGIVTRLHWLHCVTRDTKIAIWERKIIKVTLSVHCANTNATNTTSLQ